ncbi:hypothetical protein [Nocardioides sp. TF02-7]|uniref:hypothetical protein n=1 Tax=Nocardioides sp. TF02-7 TaxID=2917724 RepID=UPI001F064F2A|nr:hypothetical protein [Nocardioides sp. TF02-7]UMG94509.1 hypothetical protein MF408_11380 [Nocardioides sp. TF02-7]
MMPSPRPVEAFTTSRSANRSACPSLRSERARGVGVAGDEQRGVGDVGEVRRQLDAVPPRHHRRVDADTPHRVDGPRQADPDTEHRRQRVVEQRAELLGHAGHHSVRPGADLVVDGGGGQLLTTQVEDRHLGAGATDRRREHRAGVGVEHQIARRSAPGLRQRHPWDQQPGVDEGRDPAGHRRPRETGDPPQLRPGRRPAGAHQLQQLACGRTAAQRRGGHHL